MLAGGSPCAASAMRQLTASSALAAEARTTPGSSVWFTRLKDWNTGSWIAVVADLGLPTSRRRRCRSARR